jgi:hypothetical protein
MSAQDYYSSKGSMPGTQYGNNNSHQFFEDQHTQQGQVVERGIVSTVAGGAGGAFLGSKVGNGGTMNKILGIAAGALAANFIEHKIEEYKENKEEGKKSTIPAPTTSPRIWRHAI